MVQAMKIKVGNPTRKLVLIKLADNANDEGICWPSYQNIADHCEVTKRSVMSHVAKLEEMGLLKRKYRKTDDGSMNKSNYYYLSLDGENISSGSENRSLGSENISPPPSENISPRTSHSLEPVNEPNIDRLFEMFWSAGMRKVNKSGAKKSFIAQLKKTEKTADEFTEMLVNDVKSRLGKQYGFDSLHPTTYLNGQRWSDELKVMTEAKPVSQGVNYVGNNFTKPEGWQ